jgi:hypothetical protein
LLSRSPARSENCANLRRAISHRERRNRSARARAAATRLQPVQELDPVNSNPFPDLQVLRLRERSNASFPHSFKIHRRLFGDDPSICRAIRVCGGVRGHTPESIRHHPIARSQWSIGGRLREGQKRVRLPKVIFGPWHDTPLRGRRCVRHRTNCGATRSVLCANAERFGGMMQKSSRPWRVRSPAILGAARALLPRHGGFSDNNEQQCREQRRRGGPRGRPVGTRTAGPTRGAPAIRPRRRTHQARARHDLPAGHSSRA